MRGVRPEQLAEAMEVHTAQGLQRVRPWRLVLADGTPTNVGLFIDHGGHVCLRRDSANAEPIPEMGQVPFLDTVAVYRAKSRAVEEAATEVAS